MVDWCSIWEIRRILSTNGMYRRAHRELTLSIVSHRGLRRLFGQTIGLQLSIVWQLQAKCLLGSFSSSLTNKKMLINRVMKVPSFNRTPRLLFRPTPRPPIMINRSAASSISRWSTRWDLGVWPSVGPMVPRCIGSKTISPWLRMMRCIYFRPCWTTFASVSPLYFLLFKDFCIKVINHYLVWLFI